MKNRIPFGSLLGRGQKEEKAGMQWKPLHDDVGELESMEAWSHGAPAFDVIIDKQNVPYILEIQGPDAGVRGILDLDDADVLQDIPAEDDPQGDFWLDPAEISNERERRMKELNDLRDLARNWDKKKGEYDYPNWFAGKNGISKDKRLQPPFIRDENRPETIDGENFEHLFQNDGKVIIKPPDMAQGTGIYVYDSTQMKEAREYANRVKEKYGGFVAQRFVESGGAELAPPDLQGHAQSLRLIVPFKIKNNGEIDVEIKKFGYQRVARYSGEEAAVGARHRGKRVRTRDAGVVNRHRDAAAVPMSDTEYKLVLPAVLASIRKLADFAKKQPEHQDKIRTILDEKARALAEALNSKYRVQIEHLPYEHPHRHDKDYETQVQRALENTKNYLFFLRFLERELGAVPAELWQSKAMRYNSRCRIERVPGTSNATIELHDDEKGRKEFMFALKTDGKDAAGSLKSLLEEYVRKNRGLVSKMLRKEM